MYGVRMPWKEAKALYDRTKGRALLRYHAPNVYSVLDGETMDARLQPWDYIGRRLRAA